jgi:hypothetical protein
VQLRKDGVRKVAEALGLPSSVYARMPFPGPTLSARVIGEATASKEPGSFGDVPVYYIGREQYIANKRAVGRKKDLADIEALGEE